ncbi:MAG: High molecular weight rubredoxin [Candidatus Omnitrophota bacterium]|nr:MAG: High molecular weight rubredoxin [Candidatus Omnitrophota bacterium]
MDPNILHNLSYGMYIVSSFKGSSLNGQIANTVFQITSQPVTIGISINKQNLTHEFITASRRFSISILAEDAPLILIGRLGFKTGRTEDKFKNVKYSILGSGCPAVLENCIGYLEAEVVGTLDCGSHTVFLGQMQESKVIALAKPMTYDYYHQVKRGTTPATAPTYIKEEASKKQAGPLKKYRCSVCNYVYDPVIGDPDAGVTAGTPFEQIPDTWVCPVCGAGKKDFVSEGLRL